MIFGFSGLVLVTLLPRAEFAQAANVCYNLEAVSHGNELIHVADNSSASSTYQLIHAGNFSIQVRNPSFGFSLASRGMH